jgi:hypothetical protein
MKKTHKANTTKRKKSALTALVGVLVVAIGVLTVLYVSPIVNNAIRKDRIISIYNSFNLNDKYNVTNESIFGEKNLYSWDKSRSYSSSREYIRGANVDVTVAELKKAITNAGFTYFDEPYPNSIYTQLHFKSVKNEYVRLTVLGKVRNDAVWNKISMGAKPTAADLAIDPNIGPSNVTIKVNLDDNNE